LHIPGQKYRNLYLSSYTQGENKHKFIENFKNTKPTFHLQNKTLNSPAQAKLFLGSFLSGKTRINWACILFHCECKHKLVKPCTSISRTEYVLRSVMSNGANPCDVNGNVILYFEKIIMSLIMINVLNLELMFPLHVFLSLQ
jgi:hypothetical protein